MSNTSKKSSNKDVLLIGNGISRLSYDKQIREFQGERWGANRIYLNYGDIVDIIGGHSDVLTDAKKYRERNGLSYKIIRGPDEKEKGRVADCYFTCPVRFLLDTGTSLLAEALERDYSVSVVGYDIGGPEIYSRNHQNVNKSSWVRRWREIIKYYGHRKIRFIGYNHMPFLLSNKPAHEYSQSYMFGSNHIAGEEYEKAVEEWKNSGDPITYLRAAKLWNRGNCVFYDIAQTGKDLYPDMYIEVSEGTAIIWAERYPKILYAELPQEED
jgi:hypothetical protein